MTRQKGRRKKQDQRQFALNRVHRINERRGYLRKDNMRGQSLRAQKSTVSIRGVLIKRTVKTRARALRFVATSQRITYCQRDPLGSSYVNHIKVRLRLSLASKISLHTRARAHSTKSQFKHLARIILLHVREIHERETRKNSSVRNLKTSLSLSHRLRELACWRLITLRLPMAQSRNYI